MYMLQVSHDAAENSAVADHVASMKYNVSPFEWNHVSFTEH